MSIESETNTILENVTPDMASDVMHDVSGAVREETVTQAQAVAVALPVDAASNVSFFNRPILYEEPLKWFLLLSCLDIMMTWVVLHMGGREVNWIAQLFLEHGDLYGLVAFKFTMVVAIILLCDFVGRRNDSRGRFIAKAAVVITSFPVILASMQLLIFMYA